MKKLGIGLLSGLLGMVFMYSAPAAVLSGFDFSADSVAPSAGTFAGNWVGEAPSSGYVDLIGANTSTPGVGGFTIDFGSLQYTLTDLLFDFAGFRQGGGSSNVGDLTVTVSGTSVFANSLQETGNNGADFTNTYGITGLNQALTGAVEFAFSFERAGGNSSDFARFDNILVQGTQATPVPLPAAVWLMMAGLVGLGFINRRGDSGTRQTDALA